MHSTAVTLATTAAVTAGSSHTGALGAFSIASGLLAPALGVLAALAWHADVAQMSDASVIAVSAVDCHCSASVAQWATMLAEKMTAAAWRFLDYASLVAASVLG